LRTWSFWHLSQPASARSALGLEAAPIVLNANRKQAIVKRDADGELGGIGMFEHIMHRLLDGHDNVMPGLARDLDIAGQEEEEDHQ